MGACLQNSLIVVIAIVILAEEHFNFFVHQN